MTHSSEDVVLVVHNETVTNNSTVFYAYDDNMGIYERAKFLFMAPHQVVALILGFLAISLNFLSILAVLKTRRTLTSHYRFIVSLAVSDILIGVSVTLYLINKVLNPTGKAGFGNQSTRLVTYCVFITIKALNTTSLCITLLNLMGMAIDHYLAILRPLHYPTLMNPKRVKCLILFLWLLAIICGFSDFMSAYPKFPNYKHRFNYCEFVSMTKYQDEYPLFIIALTCLFIMVFTYVRMLMAVKQRHQYVGPVGQEMSRNKKAVYTTLLILGTFVLCWLPKCIFEIAMIIQVMIDKEKVQKFISVLFMVDRYFWDLLLMNAILDPIIYAVRMREVQYGYRKMFCFCCDKYKTRQQHSNADTTHTSLIIDNRGESFQMSVRKSNFKSRVNGSCI